MRTRRGGGSNFEGERAPGSKGVLGEEKGESEPDRSG